jgi:hypothetical protein
VCRPDETTTFNTTHDITNSPFELLKDSPRPRYQFTTVDEGGFELVRALPGASWREFEIVLPHPFQPSPSHFSAHQNNIDREDFAGSGLSFRPCETNRSSAAHETGAGAFDQHSFLGHLTL